LVCEEDSEDPDERLDFVSLEDSELKLESEEMLSIEADDSEESELRLDADEIEDSLDPDESELLVSEDD